MKIGIIGAGYIGRALAELASSAGDEVMISNSRGPDTLSSVAMATHSVAGTADEAAQFGEIVFLAIPFKARESLNAAALKGKIVGDANNYYPQRDGAISALDGFETTTSQIIAGLLPEATVVKAFNAILAKDLERDGKPAGSASRRALPIAGDDKRAKAIMAAFHDRIGFDVVDAGPLANGWRFERAKPAYCIPLPRGELEKALEKALREGENPDGSWRG